MKHIRWSDNDHYFGPFTYCKDKYHNLALVLGSGDEEYPGCRLRLSTLGHTLILALPPIIQPWRDKVFPSSWDAATIERLGRNYYYDVDEREYGFSYGGSGSIGEGGFLQVFFGRQANDGRSTQSTSFFTPWNNWSFVRHSMYDLHGNHFATESGRHSSLATEAGRNAYDEWRMTQDLCPTRTFTFTDFDGQMLSAKTRIEERQWELGTGWFKWLSVFRKPIIRRSLDIQFSGETGKRKGSWKGGTTGCGIDMKPGELHPSAFKRYCDEHEMTYKGEGIWTK
jgi:hypothetical protein